MEAAEHVAPRRGGTLGLKTWRCAWHPRGGRSAAQRGREMFQPVLFRGTPRQLRKSTAPHCLAARDCNPLGLDTPPGLRGPRGAEAGCARPWPCRLSGRGGVSQPGPPNIYDPIIISSVLLGKPTIKLCISALVSGRAAIKLHVCLSQGCGLALNARKGAGGISSATSGTGVSASVTTTTMSKQRYRPRTLKKMAVLQVAHFFQTLTRGWEYWKNGYNVWLMFWSPHMVPYIAPFLCTVVAA